MDDIKLKYGPRQAAYLNKFPDEQLYRSYSKLSDTMTTSAGAESEMAASLNNNICSVQPHHMLTKVVESFRRRFYERKSQALACTSPVPPRIQEFLAKLILKAREYQDSVRFVPGTDCMEATVSSRQNATITRRFVFSNSPQTPPSCCAYSRNGTGFPCWHGVAVICEKHGSVNVHKFIEARHLTAAWKAQYEEVDFPLRSQSDIDMVMANASSAVESNTGL